MLTVWMGLIGRLPEQAMPLPQGMGLPESLGRKGFADLVMCAAGEAAKGASVDMVYKMIVARRP